MNTYEKNIREAYSLLDKATPFRFDCGRLCGSRCCDGEDNDGMELFKGERELLEGIDAFKLHSRDGRDVLVCSGSCDRRTRPLACRFYPFYPTVRKQPDGSLRFEVVRDIRGVSTCPAVSDMLVPEYDFVRAVRRAARRLAKDECNLAILMQTTELINEIISLGELLGVNDSQKYFGCGASRRNVSVKVKSN